MSVTKKEREVGEHSIGNAASITVMARWEPEERKRSQGDRFINCRKG